MPVRALAALALACLACGSGPAPKPEVKPEVKLNRWGRPLKQGTPAPAWVERIPENGKGRLVAVGRSGPTFWPQDAINNAADDARGKLALALASHVEVLGENVESISSATLPGSTSSATPPGSTAREKTVQVNKEASDVVLQNSRIEASWTDETGERDEPGSTWALAVLDLDSVRGRAAAAPLQSATWTTGSRTAAPSWLDRLPGSRGRIFAAGYSGPTFRPDDARQYAADAALDNLATSLRSHVQAYELLVQTSTGLSVDEFSRTEDPDAAFKELVKKSAKIETSWVDDDGLRPGDPPGAVWALASIDVQSTKGHYSAVENADLGPALDPKGNAPAAASAPTAVPASAK
jgi:hypothetical protein